MLVADRTESNTAGTVAILAQGTRWALAIKQALALLLLPCCNPWDFDTAAT